MTIYYIYTINVICLILRLVCSVLNLQTWPLMHDSIYWINCYSLPSSHPDFLNLKNRDVLISVKWQKNIIIFEIENVQTKIINRKTVAELFCPPLFHLCPHFIVWLIYFILVLQLWCDPKKCTSIAVVMSKK